MYEPFNMNNLPRPDPACGGLNLIYRFIPYLVDRVISTAFIYFLDQRSS
jgi:hypothetical protein